ncbi:MAG: hypothetical protein WBR13_09480 [Allosphingosinicella sp.]
MKRVLISSAALFAATLPFAAHSAPVTTVSKQAVCVPAIVTLEDGTQVEGAICYPQGGRV